MSQIKRILVPLDFSAGSQAALEQALVFAGQFGASIDLLHVWNPTQANIAHGEIFGSTEQIGVGDRSRMMQEYLDGFSGRGVQINTRMESGAPAEVILDKAGAYDLIVMGTHGSSGVGHILKGRVTERVVRGAACPVLTIRVAESLPTGTEAALVESDVRP